MRSIARTEAGRIAPGVGFAALLAALCVAAVSAAAVGAYTVNVLHLTDTARTILTDVRFPRVVLGLLVGSALGVSGAALQGLFRNPLADPGLIGVSSGASLGAVAFVAIAGGSALALTAFGMPLAALAGGLGVTLAVWRIARVDARVETATLLLAGIALNSIAGAIIGIVTARSDDQQLRTLTFWLMGSLSAATWQLVASAVLPIALGIAALMPMARNLNALALGERDAFHLGLDVERCKNRVVAASALAVGGAVCAVGGIAFVGLIVPHIARMLLGPDHRLVLPASAILGAILLVVADAVARVAIAPAELPVGVVTALVGGPFFLWLLFRSRREVVRA